ncbi:MAG TPA: C39 family peptidase [Candidatus Peribacterales bacterium]|nr:C39 family peptidase [Candidatus Peribacterales bacterium]
MKKIALAIGALFLLLAATFVVLPKWQRHQEVIEAEKLLEHELPPVTQPSPNPSPNPSSVAHTEINLNVPFTSQAPTGNWDLPYQEACEEASALMAIRYVFGNPILDPEDADAGILDLVRANEKILGFSVDQTAEQVMALIHEIDPSIPVSLVKDPTIDLLKSELALGNIIIVPAAGRELNNPFFHAPGPLYHMLVLRGYTDDGYFITNDPGTKRGEAYLYPFDLLMDAMGDWNDGDPANGEKVVLVLKPIKIEN